MMAFSFFSHAFARVCDDLDLKTLLGRLAEELDIHARAEEAVFYPAVREVSRHRRSAR